MFEDEAREKLLKYIALTESVFRSMEVSPPEDSALRKKLDETISLSRIYLGDSKHYMEKGDYVTALVCIAYSEGLIDAMRGLGWLKYEWSLKG